MRACLELQILDRLHNQSKMAAADVMVPSGSSSVVSLSSAHIMVPSLSSMAYPSSTSSYQSIYDDTNPRCEDQQVRRKTFMCYPSRAAKIDYDEMARAGLFYTGNGCDIKCFFCNIVITNWKSGENPVEGHLLRSPSCPFVRSKSTMSNAATLKKDNVSQQHQQSTATKSPTPRSSNMSNTSRVPPVLSSSRTGDDLQMDGFSSDSDEDSADGNVLGATNKYTPAVRRATESENADCKAFNSSDYDERTQRLKGCEVASAVNKSALRRENEKLRQEMICRKCNGQRVQTLFLPCRHLVTCEHCAEQMDDCIACSQKILGTVRIFLI